LDLGALALRVIAAGVDWLGGELGVADGLVSKVLSARKVDDAADVG
jgi:hypothetical protein